MSNVNLLHNPAFLPWDGEMPTPVLRMEDLANLLSLLRTPLRSANKNVLVMGPWGMGKTMLIRQAAHQILHSPDLSSSLIPIVLPEELNGVRGLGELWLQVFSGLAQRTGDASWSRLREDLMLEQDDARLASSALHALLVWSDAQGKRLLLVLENLDLLVAEQLSPEDLRHLVRILKSEKRIRVLATSTSPPVWPADISPEGIFRRIWLEPCSTDDCVRLWNYASKQPMDERCRRPVAILTGGNPRVVVSLASSVHGLGVDALLHAWDHHIDSYTPYFKHRIESLAVTERKVFLALAELWRPSLAREVAARARLEVSATSSLLRRLVQRGEVVEVEQKSRKNLYKVADRPLNVFCLLRTGGYPAERWRALGRFMRSFYGPEHADADLEILPLTAHLCHLMRALAQSEDYWQQIEVDPSLPWPQGSFDALLDDMENLEEAIEELQSTMELSPFDAWPHLALGDLLQESGKLDDAEREYRSAFELEPESHWALMRLAPLCENQGRLDESEALWRSAMLLAPEEAAPKAGLAALLAELARDAPQERERLAREALLAEPKNASHWLLLGVVLADDLLRHDEALGAFEHALLLDPSSIPALCGVAVMEMRAGKPGSHELPLRQAVEIDPSFLPGWETLLCSLIMQERIDEARELFCGGHAREAVAMDLMAWRVPRILLSRAGNVQEAEGWLRSAHRVFGSSVAFLLADVLGRQGRWTDAIGLITPLLEQAPDVRQSSECIGFLILAAASGHARECIDALIGAMNGSNLEPLSIAIGLDLGEELLVPDEVRLVALDVQERLRTAQRKNTKR